MEVVYWIIISILFVVAFVGLVYPIIPSVLFLLAGFLLYGVFFSFEPFSWLFWLIQGLFVVLLFAADYVANLIGIKKYGGSKAGVWGSTIGIIAGPFVIPIFGILIGPFIGAIAAELIVNKRSLSESVKVGVGSVIGFISSVITKTIIQVIMVGYFFMVVL
ncbi:hypothetical protein COJ85_13715 [Bacillus sp. AFS076308]|uniref:DUF456 domain-containing protein n=1 Tax=unclassified Bacillus (in: firmicutes) TaxID=185979 RepID=UPI000BF5B011|nr:MULTISPECIES: DUF456 domain-containing protein [unclassified Bacillus (in: firmicutes)]PFO03701.1 hypothetical protein COJ85_13715 [Bacillus sp. AFS076308]PGV54432.1 hypothetical protein COD92_05025 [Bacillus sp. AFS037270]